MHLREPGFVNCNRNRKILKRFGIEIQHWPCEPNLPKNVAAFIDLPPILHRHSSGFCLSSNSPSNTLCDHMLASLKGRFRMSSPLNATACNSSFSLTSIIWYFNLSDPAKILLKSATLMFFITGPGSAPAEEGAVLVNNRWRTTVPAARLIFKARTHTRPAIIRSTILKSRELLLNKKSIHNK